MRHAKPCFCCAGPPTNQVPHAVKAVKAIEVCLISWIKYDEIKKVVFAIALNKSMHLFFVDKMFTISATVDPTVLAVLTTPRAI